MNESSHPRYRDNEGSRFYRADHLSPEETWLALGDELARVLDDAQQAFWRKPLRLDREGDVDSAGILDRTRAAAALYAGVLRVHPFADGNHRVSFVVLSAALWSLGLSNIEFEEDDELIVHDDALVSALISKEGNIEPFARLLAELIERSTASGT